VYSALSTILHYTFILEHNWCLTKLGLTTPEEENTPICSVDPGKSYTECGTVMFILRRLKEMKFKRMDMG